METKKSKTQKFGKGKIANALGNILKLNYGPDSWRSFISNPSWVVKCPKYIKTFKALNIPHKTKLKGIKYVAARNFYFFGFIEAKWIRPDIAIVIW